MRSHPLPAVLACAVAGSALLIGCASSDDAAPTAESGAETTAAPTTSSLEPHVAPPGETHQSSGGVTTAVGTPADSTEEEYFQACAAAKAWMTEKGGDRTTLFEPYLAELQSSDSAGPGTFGTPWSALAPARQAAVIVAAEAAANDLCG